MDSSVNLFEAVLESDYKLVNSLITKGLEVNCFSHTGEMPLHLAIKKGHSDIALLLISNGSEINLKNNEDKTPLFIAAESNNLVVVKTLLSKANLNVNLYCYGKTPLHVACEEGHVSVVKELVNNYRTMFWASVRYLQDLPLHIAVSHGYSEITLLLLDKMTSVNSVDKDGRTPLWLALFRKHGEIVKILLSNYRVNTNFRYEGNSPLLYAICQHMNDEIKLLVEKGANLLVRDSEKRTVLHLCALEGMPDLVQFFIDKGADLSAIDSTGFNPFHYAVTRWDFDVINVFIKNGVNIDGRVNNASYGHTPLQIVVKRGNFDVAKFLIENGADLNARDPKTHYAVNRGGTLLHWACRQYSDGSKTIRFLVENGANINAEADDGRTPICLAIKHAHNTEQLKYLIDNGASLNTDRGGTPLYWAFYMRYYDVAKFLIENGADVNYPIDNFNEEWDRRSTPLHRAGDLSLVQLLIRKGANVNALEINGNTPLHNACNLSIAKCLVENGASLTICNFQGDTPLHSAQSAHIAEYLIENGVHVNALNHKGCSPIHSAKNVHIARLLIENGADVNVVSKDGRNVLHSVAASDSYSETADLIDYFIEKGIDPNGVDSNGSTPLKLSSLSLNYEVSKKLLNNGATLRLFNVETNGYDLYYLKWLNELFVALKSDQPVSKSMGLVRSHLPLNYKEGDTKSTALHIAAQYGRKVFVDLVLNKMSKNIQSFKYCNKINVNARDVNGLTPLHVAALKNHVDIANSLLQAGAVYNAKTLSGETPIELTESTAIKNLLTKVEEAFNASKSEDIVKLRECVDKEKNIINALNEDGCSLLHIACLRSCSDSISLLLEKGADITLVNNNRQTVLHLAASVKDHNAVKTFLKIFVQKLKTSNNIKGNRIFDRRSFEFSLFFDFINLRTLDEQTALHIASKMGSFEIVKDLIKYGIMFDSKDKYGKTAADFSKDENIISLLMSTQSLFNDAKFGNPDIINNLKNIKNNNITVTKLTSNKFGNSLTEYLTFNGHDIIAREIEELKLLDIPQEFLGVSLITSLESDDQNDSEIEIFGLFD